MPRLSVVIPVRNRAGTRLRNCLNSLRWQQLDASEVEIVLSDYGSDDEHARSIAALADDFAAKVARNEEFGDWNRSRALNLGIQATTGEYVWCTDADMIFAPNFVPEMLAVHDQKPGKALVVCACSDLPESVPERDYELADFPMLSKASTRRRAINKNSLGTGACQSATRAFFFHARGYDERYVYWGSEDSDMRDRALAYGLEMVWITERTEMLHQWHPTSRYSRLVQNRKNALRYWFTRHQIVKNEQRWGNLA